MGPDHIQEKAIRPRRPSLPDFAYRLAHSVGLSNMSHQEMETFCSLVHDIRAGNIPSRPSHIEEFAERVLYALGASPKTPQQMHAFLRECHDGEDF